MKPLAKRPGIIVENTRYLLGRDLDDFPSVATSVYGQELPLIAGNGDWVLTIHLEHIGYLSRPIVWGHQIHKNGYIEWIVRHWIIDRLELTLNVKIINELLNKLESLKTDKEDPAAIEEAIFSWAKTVSGVMSDGSSNDISFSARSLYEWGVDEDLPGFSEHRLYELSELKTRRQASGALVAMRDEDLGPFTRLELSLIEAALNSNPQVGLRERAAYYLGRDWGLRPIQLALLQTSDLGCDELGPYIMVPCVKGKKRSVLRRAPSNMVKRYIAEDTEAAIKCQCEIAYSEAADNIDLIGSIIGPAEAAKLPIPLFPAGKRSETRVRRYCENIKILKYVLHIDSHAISRLVRNLTHKLSLTTKTSTLFNDSSRVMNISAYRLRRTKGTAMVLSGATPEEVAEALDHVSVDSIQYYFRYNLELHDFINRAHATSPEIVEAINIWQGRIDSPAEIKPREMTIGNLGKCTLGKPCPHHPTVTCYSCQKFRPNMSADHGKALEDIQTYQEMISSASTGHVSKQLEVSIHGAKALILIINSQGILPDD